MDDVILYVSEKISMVDMDYEKLQGVDELTTAFEDAFLTRMENLQGDQIPD